MKTDSDFASTHATALESRRSRRLFYAFACLALLVGMGMNGDGCNVPIDPGGGGGGNNNGGGNNGGTSNIILLASDHIMGSPNASVIVVEYSDFQCPFCGRFARQEFSKLKQNYIDTGKIRFVFRHFPLRNIHNRAEPSARATECASDQGHFFEYHDLVFGTVSPGTTSTILTDDQLRLHAQTLGMDLNAFDNCFPPGDGKAPRVQQDVTSGTALGVSSTPTFFVNGEQVTGFRTAEELGEIIDRKINGG